MRFNAANLGPTLLSVIYSLYAELSLKRVMECQLATSEEFQVLKGRLLGEVKRLYNTLGQNHSPVSRRLMETKIQVICDTIETAGRNHTMKMFELCSMTEDRIDAQEREIEEARTFEEKEDLYHSIVLTNGSLE
jgi:hypothetical protein